MIEAVMLWNEPNNKSHWDFEIDPEWTRFARDGASSPARRSRPRARACRACSAASRRSIPRSSPNMQAQGVLDHVDAVAVHGFPLDWNHWQIDEWPDEARRRSEAVTDLPVWVSEVGVSTFGAEEVQEFGLRRTAELLLGRAPRIHWYSLYDLPRAWPATTRHREAEGSSYYRHFYMGLLREDGTPKRALEHFAELHARARHLPVVPLRGPPAGRRGALAAAARREAPAHRPELGRCLPPERPRLVRSPDGGARGVRGHAHLLLHARSSGA